MSEWEDKLRTELRAIATGLPFPLPVHGGGAYCPWCGETHETITFGLNECHCGKCFIVSFPDWAEDEQLYSWATFTAADHEVLDKRPDLLPEFKPNDRLQQIYFNLKVDELGFRGTA